MLAQIKKNTNTWWRFEVSFKFKKSRVSKIKVASSTKVQTLHLLIATRVWTVGYHLYLANRISTECKIHSLEPELRLGRATFRLRVRFFSQLWKKNPPIRRSSLLKAASMKNFTSEISYVNSYKRITTVKEHKEWSPTCEDTTVRRVDICEQDEYSWIQPVAAVTQSLVNIVHTAPSENISTNARPFSNAVHIFYRSIFTGEWPLVTYFPILPHDSASLKSGNFRGCWLEGYDSLTDRYGLRWGRCSDFVHQYHFLFKSISLIDNNIVSVAAILTLTRESSVNQCLSPTNKWL